MTERLRALLFTAIKLTAFAALVCGVVVAQRTVGWVHLGLMLLCLCGLLVMLWRYNRTYT